MAKPSVPVSERALLARINRHLAPAAVLKKAKGARARAELGDFYLLDLRRNVPCRPRVKLEAYGRELGVLAPYERLCE